MKTRNLFYRVVTMMTLLAVLLPQGAASPARSACADSAVPFNKHTIDSTFDGAHLPAADPNASWQEVGTGSATGGGISDNSGSSWFPSVAIAPDGTPYVAWADDSGGDGAEIYVRRWNGSSWEEVGIGSASGGGISGNSGDSLTD